MRAVVLTGHGGPDKLVYREDVPQPPVAPDEVLIKVGACGVNNTDLWTREGAYGNGDDPASPTATAGWKAEPMQFPRIQGLDIAGYVVAVGSAVDAARVGERVLVNPTIYRGTGDGIAAADIIGSERDGGFAEYVAVPATNAHAVTSSFSDAELASFPCSYLTAEHMLNRARVAAGETVLITGASGGVGSALVQLAARVRHARVIAVVGQGKEDALRALGATHIVTRQHNDLEHAVATLTSQQGVDVVADVVGGAQFATLMRVLRAHGRYVAAGAIAGPLVQLDLRTLYLRHLEIIGSTMGTRAEFTALVGYIEQGLLTPIVAQTYPLHAIHQAQADFAAKGFVGNLVLIPGAATHLAPTAVE